MKDSSFPELGIEHFEQTLSSEIADELSSLFSSKNQSENKLWICCFSEVSSTMDVGKKLLSLREEQPIRTSIFPCIALPRDILPRETFSEVIVTLSRSQSKGRGRLSRTWVSEKDKGIYLTVSFKTFSPGLSFDGLSLVMGLAVVSFLQEYGLNCFIKWPNDVLLVHDEQLKKICGILIELQTIGDKTSVHIGIGLNVRRQEVSGARKAISLEEVGIINKSIAELNAKLVKDVLGFLSDFCSFGVGGFQERLETYSVFKCFDLAVSGADIVGNARVLGLDTLGGLRIEDKNGNVRVLYSGEVEIVDVIGN